MKKPNFKGKPYVFSVKIWLNRALLPQFIALFSSQKDPELQEIWSPKVGASRPFFYCGLQAVKETFCYPSSCSLLS